MEVYAQRLKPGEDLKESIQQLARDNKIIAGVVLSAVGSVESITLRMAGATAKKEDIRTYNGEYEIVSITGTVTATSSHLHIAISDSEGIVVGGHLKGGSIVKTTCEIVIGAANNLVFDRQPDADTGFDELTVSENPE